MEQMMDRALDSFFMGLPMQVLIFNLLIGLSLLFLGVACQKKQPSSKLKRIAAIVSIWIGALGTLSALAQLLFR